MNKHLYRIVFNKRRGQLMVVAEVISSQGKSAPGERPAASTSSNAGASRPLSAWRPLCLALYAALGGLAVLPLHAQIVADPSAPGAQRPAVLRTDSGVPQVDIQAPSAAGVSRNTYSQFDVDKRGVIDGIQTDIDTGTLTNLGTGRIYGDRISIGAATVLNDVEGGVAGTIAARGNLVLGAGTINNREHALIFSGGDMAIGGAVDGNRNAVGSASGITVASAHIEALGNMAVNATRVDLLNNHFSATSSFGSGGEVYINEYEADLKRYATDAAGVSTRLIAGNRYLVTPDGQYSTFQQYNIVRTTGTTVVTASDPGLLAAGRNLTINAGTVLNANSQIVAGMTLSIPAASLNNQSTANQTVIRETGTVTSYEWLDVPVNVDDPYFEVRHDSSSYTNETIVGSGTATPYQWTKSAAPGAKSGIAVNATTSAAGAASVGAASQVAVAAQGAVAPVGAATGKLASLASGAIGDVKAQLADASQTGLGELTVKTFTPGGLDHVVDAGASGPVKSVGVSGSVGPLAGAINAAIDAAAGSVGKVAIGDRKNAGQTGSVSAVGGVQGTGAIAGAAGGADVGQLPVTPGQAVIGTRKDAVTSTAVTGTSAGNAPVTVVGTVPDTKVSDGVVAAQPAAPLAGANGSGLATPAAGATPGQTPGPTPGTAKPNVQGITEVALATPTGTAEVVRTNTLPPTVPNASLYQVAPAPEATHLIETDPRFANYREWTSADYLTSKVPTDPNVTQKRLGDGFYEQQLVREQMTALTGYRYSGDYTSDEEQYRGLMDAAASFATTWNLRPGVALTPAQMAALTGDIVWLVEQQVTLADGSTQKVLVPQVYVRLREGDLDGSGALLSGRNVDIALSGDLTNSGTIAGREVVRISAENIDNLSGRIHGNDVAVSARKDLNNISGTISANNALIATAGRDLNIATGVASIDRGNDGVASALGRVAGLYVTGGDGTLVASAGRDLNIAGGIVSNNALAGTTSLLAAGNLNVYQSLATTSSTAIGSAPILDLRSSELSAMGSMTLKAGTDLSIIGSSATANQSLIATAGRDITVRSTTASTASQNGKTSTSSTEIDALAGLYVNGTGSDSKLIVSAGRDLNLTAAVVGNAGEGGVTALSALRDLNLGTVGVAARTDVVTNANNFRKEGTTSEVGTQINGAGSILLNAGNNLSVRAGEVNAATELSVAAGNNIDITTGAATYALDQASQTVKKSTFSKKVTTKRDTVDAVTAIASTLTGGTLSMNAGNDLNITGSAVVGEDAVLLAAKNNINIAAGVDTNSEWNHVEEKKSGFLSGGGGFGLSYGTRTTTTDQNRDAVTQSGQARSMVGSINGNLTLDAGNAIKVGGTDMSAGQGMSLTAKNVTIDPGQDKIDTKFASRVVQDALTLKVGGSVVNAIQSVQSVQQTAEATGNTRVQAMAAATAALAVKSAAADYAKEGLSVSVSLTAGHSESVQTSTTSETLHTGSVLTAGKDVSIVAKGDGANSNINIVGSDINAGKNVSLAAAGQVNLVAAQDLESQHSESKSLSAEAGVAASYSSNNGTAVGFTASLSASKGHEDGEGTTQVNSQVKAGQTLTIGSGGDTTIKGAVASANQVVADVGGNLNIESLQDTAKFDSKSQSANVSGTVGYGASVSGSVNQTTIKSDYASVQEQSGIKAGDGGFQINVGGNTDLKGAVISSTEAGIAANSLVTKTLTQSEIENHATMEATSIGLSGSSTVAGTGDAPEGGAGKVYMANQGKTGQTASVSGLAYTSSAKDSSTRSGSSKGFVEINDESAQSILSNTNVNNSLAEIDRNVTSGSDTSNKIGNSFNRNEIQTTLAVTSSFAAAGAKAVGDYAASQLKDAELLRIEALSKTASERESLINEAVALENLWEEGGSARTALHTVVGALAGGASGAVGAGATALATPYIAKIKELDIPSGLKDALVVAAGAGIGAIAGAESGAIAAANELENNFLKHSQAKGMREEFNKCEQKTGGCSDSDYVAIRDKYISLSNQNISQVQDCIKNGNVECVKSLEGQVASIGELGNGLVGVDYRVLAGRQSNITDYGSIMGSASLFGTDIQQTQEIANFRQAQCAGLTTSACNILVNQALDDRKIRMLVLGAASAGINKLTGVAVKKIAVIRESNILNAAMSEEVKKTTIANNISRDENMTSLRSSEEINAIFRKINWEDPFAANTWVSVSVSCIGDKNYMVVSGGTGQAQNIDLGKGYFGSFATPDPIPSQLYARETLAITPVMKADVSKVVALETIKPMAVMEGKIGPQVPESLYPGGGKQIFYDYPDPKQRGINLRALGPTTALPPTTKVSTPIILENQKNSMVH